MRTSPVTPAAREACWGALPLCWSFLPRALPLLFALAWNGAHCEPVPQCQLSNRIVFLIEVAVALAIAASLGLLVRSLFNKAMNERMAGRPGTQQLLLVAIILLIPFLLALMMF